MFRKYITIFLFAAFTLVACDNGGYDTRTGDAQTDPGVAGTDTETERDAEMGAPRERDMDTRTGSIRTRPGTESDTGMGPGTTTNPGTGAIPGGATSPDTGVDSPDTDTGVGDTTGGDTTGSP